MLPLCLGQLFGHLRPPPERPLCPARLPRARRLAETLTHTHPHTRTHTAARKEVALFHEGSRCSLEAVEVADRLLERERGCRPCRPPRRGRKKGAEAAARVWGREGGNPIRPSYTTV